LTAGEAVRDAAAVAIASGNPQKAVEWLEQGRSIIWSQLLNLRTPVDTLNNSHPVLAKDLLFLSMQLEGSGHRKTDGLSNKSGTQQSIELDKAHQYALARDALLKEIRGLESFDRFLLPQTIPELTPAAQKGPVVILNPGDKQCDALILTTGNNGVMHIPLTDFTPEDAGSITQSFNHLVGTRSQRLKGKREGELHPQDQFAQILSKIWSGIVKPVLEGLAITVSLFFSKCSVSTSINLL
jgi:hypothetical protein